MELPIINFKRNGLDEVVPLEAVVTAKFAAFEKYFDGAAARVCEVEFVKDAPANAGPVHRVKAHLHVDGRAFHAEAVAESFEKAVDEVRDELDKELRRAKSKEDTLSKEAGRAAKEQLLGS